jgi:hypothetical protein
MALAGNKIKRKKCKKRQYSKKNAKKVLAYLRSLHRREKRWYKCLICNTYHLTSQPK